MRAEKTARTGAGVVYARKRTVWIWEKPSQQSRRLGYLRGGTSLKLVSGEPVRGPGCREGYWAVAPRGFVCSGAAVTRDPQDRAVRVHELLSATRTPLPFRFAISNGAPMYRRLPSKEEWARVERDLGAAGSFHRYRWNERHERLAEEKLVEPTDAVPFFLSNGGSARAEREAELVRMIMPLGSTFAFTRAFSHEGRVFLLSSDGTIVPADRVRPFRASRFTGLRLNGEGELAVAFPRAGGAKKYVRTDGGPAASDAAPFPARTAVFLDPTTPPVRERGTAFRAVRERGASGQVIYLSESEASVVTRRPRPARAAAGDKWIVVSISSGTLVAYEGDRPVFATLVSPGAGGVLRKGEDPVAKSKTPLGTYRLQYKYLTQTMSPQKDKPETERTFWMGEVPYAQYFQVPFALHGVYWHEDFGQFMSGGCVNLSPDDAAWLFSWTTPALPQGWDAVWAGGENGQGTLVVIER